MIILAKTIFFKKEKTIVLVQRTDIKEATELTNKIKDHVGLLTGLTAFFNANLASVLGIATASSYIYDKHLANIISKYNFKIAVAKTRVFPRDLRLLCKESEAIQLTDHISIYFVFPEYSLLSIAEDLNGLIPTEEAELNYDVRFWRD